ATFYRIADGALSPLIGPMDTKEFYQVLDEEVIIRNGKKYAWSIPIAFPIKKTDGEKLKIGQTVAVVTKKGELLGTLEIKDFFYFDKEKYNKVVYGTERTDHPGARIVNNDPRDYLLGGIITALPQKKNKKLAKYLLSPQESRDLFKKKGWERIVAFQTRNPLHRAHEYAMVAAVEILTSQGIFTGIVLNPLIGETKSDDVSAELRMQCYENLKKKKLLGKGDIDPEIWKRIGYDINKVFELIALDIKMFYGGPKEAVMHAIYRQNYGFTDLIIGRKHADAPFDDGDNIWGDFDAQEKFKKLKGELRINNLNVGFAAYYQELGRVALMNSDLAKGLKPFAISGKELRKQLHAGKLPDERMIRPETAKILIKAYK
ncbi:MAG: sulfate adenylyltransferase, partial [Candidatus Margulisbacteria bacterium]|nr:sulfate adenylyltransferase [Candidatus Margulisiibacteriota bacterium]